MIPVLYPANSTSFTTFGLGALTDTLSCEVTEERNGVFECILKYPITGQHYKLIAKERIIKAKPNDTGEPQAFRIYRITKPLDGVVTVYGQHISYDLANVPVMPFYAESRSPSLLLNQLLAGDSRFTGWTDYSEAKEFSVTTPKSVRACLGGTEGSMLSKWHGEFEWDNFTVKFHSHRGEKTGVVIEYGKNLTSLEQDEDNSGVYTQLLPYAVYTQEGSETETVVTLPEQTLPIVSEEMVRNKTLILDLTDRFESGTDITEDALRAAANDYIKENPLGATVPTVKVAFEPLWKQPEYSALLERVRLCDSVTIRHTALGVNVSATVIETVYDSLAERYVSITLGNEKSSMITTLSEVQSSVGKVETAVNRFPKLLQTAISNATSLITGQTGGYVVLHGDETGRPYELLILDAPTIQDAVNVWRWNVNGLGFSRNGYNGPYETAITADGQIVADFITSGSLIANIIKAGVIQSQDGSSWWDLESGEVMFSAYATTDSLEEVGSRISQFQQSVDGLNSYVASMTESVESVTGDLVEEQKNIRLIEGQVSELQQTVGGLSLTVQEQYSGGINFVRNSAGLNGLSDDWTYAGTVTAQQGAETKNSTVSNSCFQLNAYSTLTQVVDSIVPGQSYRLTVKAKKTSTYNAYVRAIINGDTEIDLFNNSDTFEWTEFSSVLPGVQDSVITIKIYSRDASLFISDIMLTEGTTLHKWTPAPNEIYTAEVSYFLSKKEVKSMKSIWTGIQIAFSALGGFLGWFLGGADGFLYALIAFVVIDYITGVMCAIADKSLSSEVGFKGICRKVLIFILVGIGNIIDVYVLGDAGVLRTAVIFFYLSNEGVSLLENAAHLGLPVPDKLKDVLQQLHNKEVN